MKNALRRRRLPTSIAAALLGLTLSLAGPSARAAEQLVFVSGAFRRSIPVADLEALVETGEVRGLLADVLHVSNQDPAVVAELLNQPLSMPLTLVSRLLNTRIGEALLDRVAQVIYPLKAADVGRQALRAAVILGLAEGDGSISALGFLQAYPTRELEVNIPALMQVAAQASSVAELVRFFSESPLDGLRESNGSAQPSQAEP